MNWVLKGVVSCLIFLSAAGCKDAVKLTVDDFTMALAAEGFSLEEEEYDQASENKRYFLVNPGRTCIFQWRRLQMKIPQGKRQN